MAITIYEDNSVLGGGAWTDSDGAVWVPNDPDGSNDRARLQAMLDSGEAVLAPWVPPPLTPAVASAEATLAEAVLLLGRSVGVAWPDELLEKLKALQGGGP